MAVMTQDGAKVGQTTYHARVDRFAEADEYPVHIWGEEFDTQIAAVVATQRKMTEKGDDTHGSITEGTYESYDFDDDEYGRVRDGSWVESNVQWDLYFNSDGQLTIDKEEW